MTQFGIGSLTQSSHLWKFIMDATELGQARVRQNKITASRA
jgi:hypothetical protein